MVCNEIVNKADNKNKSLSESKGNQKVNDRGVASTGMSLKLILHISKSEDGLFNISIDYEANGKKCSSLTLRHKVITEGIKVTLEPILVMAPNGTQKELDAHYAAYPA